MVQWIGVTCQCRAPGSILGPGRSRMPCSSCAGATVTEARLSRAARRPAEPGAAATEARAPGARALQRETRPHEKPAPHRAPGERPAPSAAGETPAHSSEGRAQSKKQQLSWTSNVAVIFPVVL